MKLWTLYAELCGASMKLYFKVISYSLVALIAFASPNQALSTGKVVPETSTSDFVASIPETSKFNSSELADGFYLIVKEQKDRASLGTIAKDEKILVNDFQFIAPEERGETTYVVVNKNSFIPISLQGKPIKDTDQKGKPKLEILLAEKQIKPLAKFTSENVMKNVAIVIGGKIVTMHKIREPILGGKLQITRCTDHGCEALYTELVKDQH